MVTIYWVRRDFRLRDNAALQKAKALGLPVLPVYIYAPGDEGPWGLGSASKWWLHHSLLAFAEALKEHGLQLLVEKGEPVEVLRKLIRNTGASNLLFNRLYDPAGCSRELEVIELAASHGCDCESYPGGLLFEPGTLMTKEGNPYKVFTPFWNTAARLDSEQPSKEVKGELKGKSIRGEGLSIKELGLLPRIDWDRGFYSAWEPGESGAWKRLKKFAASGLSAYDRARDFPSEEGTSCLSPHLHFGEITPRQIWHTLSDHPKSKGYLRELGWREFAHHLLYFFPQTPLRPLRKEFEAFPWKKDALALRKWQRGKTGVPIVDAGMRQLWQTGWMHNRVRMIVGSYLVKDLMIPWQEGAKWFWDTLVDADLANNTLGWQWVAGCGADAAPYFRIFNPTSQGERFDPEGDYVRRFVPELCHMPAKWIHKPHLAPPEVLAKAEVVLGKTYPFPIVDHSLARKSALQVYKKFTEK